LLGELCQQLYERPVSVDHPKSAIAGADLGASNNGQRARVRINAPKMLPKKQPGASDVICATNSWRNLMPGTRQQQLQDILLALLPSDHSPVGNGTLSEEFLKGAKAQGLKVAADEFQAVREALVASGQAIKGKGRGGSTARATGAQRPDFDLQAVHLNP
jgi:hypothetical protein